MTTKAQRLSNYKFSVPSTTQGIPCILGVTTYEKTPPEHFLTAPSDLDASGFYEIEYTILDRAGYSAKWLQDKVTEEDEDRHIVAIRE